MGHYFMEHSDYHDTPMRKVRFCHMGHYFMEPSDYHVTPLRKAKIASHGPLLHGT
jgi:hypothetical protein